MKNALLEVYKYDRTTVYEINSNCDIVTVFPSDVKSDTTTIETIKDAVVLWNNPWSPNREVFKIHFDQQANLWRCECSRIPYDGCYVTLTTFGHYPESALTRYYEMSIALPRHYDVLDVEI